MDRKRMVSSLVEYYTNGNKSQFAKMLGITPQTINTWISRNTFNAELIYAKCEGVSANWLLKVPSQNRQSGRSPAHSPLQSGGDGRIGFLVQRCRCDSDQLYIVAGSACMRWGCLCARGFDVPITQKRRYCPLQAGTRHAVRDFLG